MAFWPLEPSVVFLNHGSFGSCPTPVLEEQSRLRAQLEAEPIEFLDRRLEKMADDARAALGKFLGANPDDLVHVTNATSGVNTVLRSLKFVAGDELLITNHGYNACNNAVRFIAEQHGATVVVAKVPFPLRSPEEVIESVMRATTPRTRLAIVDHVSSPTGLVFPIETMIAKLKERGVETLVDGAHAPGMVPLNLNQLDAAYYTGNLHKWLCVPKSAGFLWVKKSLQSRIHPLVISHGFNSTRSDKSRFQLEFGWTGTYDPTPWLCLPKALEALSSLETGGLPALMNRNRRLALEARALFVSTPPAPDEMIGSLVSWPIPDGDAHELHEQLLQRGVEVPVFHWPNHPKRLMRISAQHYNSLGDYQRLKSELNQLL